MSKLSEFVGGGKEIEIMGKKLEIFPLKVKDLEMFKENLTEQEKIDLSKKLIKRSLNDPEVTDKEIDNMDIEACMGLLEEITKLNGFKDERLEQIKTNIARRRE